MNRRSMLMVLGSLMSLNGLQRASGRSIDATTLRTRLGTVALQLHERLPTNMSSAAATTLCGLVAARCRASRSVSPALVQSTQDACLRLTNSSQTRLDRQTRQQLAVFNELSRQFVHSTAC